MTIKINQALYKPYEDVLLMFTFQVSYNITRINTPPMQFDPRYQFDTFLPNEYANNTIVNFTLRGIAVGSPIISSSYEELKTLPIYERISPLFWYPSRKFQE